jgi:hypothetical protein
VKHQPSLDANGQYRKQLATPTLMNQCSIDKYQNPFNAVRKFEIPQQNEAAQEARNSETPNKVIQRQDSILDHTPVKT